MKRFIFSILFFVGVSSVGASQNVGDFQSRQTGDWSDSNTWEEWDGSAWINTLNVPDGTESQIELVSSFSVTISAGNTIEISSGTLLLNNGTIILETDGRSIGVLRVSGTMTNNQGSITSGSATNKLFFLSGAVYNHNFTTTEGTIPTASWAVSSTVNVTGYTSNGTAPSGLNQTFHDFNWNCQNMTTSFFDLGGNLNDVNGNLTVSSTGTGSLSMSDFSASTINVDGSFTISGNSEVYFNFQELLTYNIGADLILSSSLNTYFGDEADLTLNISNDLIVNGTGTYDFGGFSGSANTIINLAGGFSQTNGSIVATGTGSKTINFNGGNLVTYEKGGGTFSGSINFNISSSTNVNAGSSIFEGSGNFTLGSGSVLAFANINGITTSSSGVIQVPSSNRTYNTGATFEYNNDTDSQFLGNGFPTSGVNLTINNTGGGVNMNDHLTISSGRTLTLAEGNLNIGDGNLLTLNGTVSTTNGGLSGGALSNLTIGGTGAFGTLVFVGTNQLGDFTINRTSSGSVTLGGDLIVNGTFDQIAGELNLNGNEFTISGDFTQSGGIINSTATSTLAINGSGTLPTSTAFSGDLQKLNLDRASTTFETGGSNYTIDSLGLFSGTYSFDVAAVSIADGGYVERRDGGTILNPLTAVGSYDLYYLNNSTMSSGPELLSSSTAIANLEKAGASTLTITNDFTVNGDLTFSNGSFNAGSNIISLNGNLVTNAGSTLSDATITFDGITNLSGSNTPTFGSITVNGTFNPTSNLNVNGDIINNGTLNSTNGTLTINALSQLGGTNPITVNNFTIDASGDVTANSTQALQINGDLINNGAFDANGGTVIFGGTTSISGSVPNFANVQIDGTLNAPATLNISGGLTNNGTFNDNDGIINMNGTGTRAIAGTSPFSVYTLNVTGGTINNTNSAGVTIENGINVGASTTLSVDGGGSGTMTLRSIQGQDAFIGEVPSTSTLSGNLNVQRAIYTVGGDSRGYHIVGFPVTGLSVSEIQDEISVTGPFTSASPCPTSDCTYSIYSFDETAAGNGVFNDGYTGFPTSGVSQGFEEGEGYYIFTYAGETPVSLEGNGTIFSGDFSTTLSRTGTSDGSGWHMVSNPYPATTDWSQWGNSNVFGSTAYLWNPNTEGYEVYDGGTQQLIPQGQGFFVRAISDGVTLTATEATKVEGNTPTYLRQAPQERFEIILKTPDYDDKTIVSFNENATDNFEPQYDAPRLLNTYETLSTFTADNDTVKVNRLASSEVDSNCGRSIRLNLEQMVAEVDYAIDFNGINNITSQEIILIDHYLNTETIVTENLVYDFQVTEETNSTGADRFELVLSKNGPSQIEVKTADVCPEQNGLMRFQNTDLYANYIIYKNNEVIATAEGNGVELEIEIQNEFLSNEVNSFDIKAFISGCDTVNVGNAQIQVIETLTYDNEVSGSSICKIENQAPFSVSTQAGVTYHILDNQDTIQSFEGNGSLYEGFLATQNFKDGSNEFVISAQKDDCESGTLNQALTFDFYKDAIIDEIDNHSICLNDTTTLELSANVEMSNYQLYIGDELISDESASFLNLSPKETTTYTLTGVPENGCEVNKINFTIAVNDLAKPGILVSANILESSVEGDAFQWYLDGEILENETGKILIAKQSGNYTVKVTKSNCSKVSDSFKFNEEVLSANKALNNALNIYPNPVEDNMYIELNDINSANVTIFTISGKFIDSFEINSSQSEVEMSKYSKGTYLIKFESGKGSVTKRFLKQ